MSTSVFVSSVSLRLEEIRHQIGRSLRQLGHAPVLFEYESFAKVGSPSMIKTCLAQVENCDIYMLIIGEEVGFYSEEYGKSVTHLELRKALSANKTIIVFVEKFLHQYYFKEYRHAFRELQKDPQFAGKIPSVEAVYRKLGTTRIKKEVFDILNDAEKTGPWLFSFENASDIAEILKSELSSLLQKYVQLRNNKQIHTIDDVTQASQRFVQLDRFIYDIRPNIQTIALRNIDEAMKKVQANIKGGVVYYSEGVGIDFELITVGNCEGTSLYQFDATSGTMVQISKSGLAAGRDRYALSDRDSFVSRTFADYFASTVSGDLQEHQVFLKNNVLYVCRVFNDYVHALHFPIEGIHVELELLTTKTDDIFSGIMGLRANTDIIKFFELFLL